MVYNEIYAQVISRMRMRPLNEFSGELAVLDARINTRSLMCRALTQLKERVNDAPFAFGCQIKPLKLDNFKSCGTIPRVKRSQHSKCSTYMAAIWAKKIKITTNA